MEQTNEAEQEHSKNRGVDSMFKLVRENLREIVGRSTVHGFPTLSSTEVHTVVKAMWLVILCFSWGYFIYQTFNTISLFSSYPKATQILVAYEPIVDFPAVVICNLNAYDQYMTNDIMKKNLQDNDITLNRSSSFKEYVDSANDQLKSILDFEWANGTLETSDLYLDGFYALQQFPSCEFQGQRCSPEDFYWFHDYNFGNCFRFNGGGDLENQTRPESNFTTYPVKKSYKPGWKNGLRLELYAGEQIYQIQYAFKAGFRVIIHNQTIIPFPDQDGIDIPTGTQTNIGIRRKFLNRLPSPYSDCIDQLTENVAKQNTILEIIYAKYQSGEIKQYQASYCMAICQQIFIVKSCKCKALKLKMLNLDFFDEEGDKLQGCFEKSDVSCMTSAEKNFYNTDEVEKCYSSCPNECNLVNYDFELSQSTFGNKWFSDFNVQVEDKSYLYYYARLGDTDVYSLMRTSSLALNVFYESMEYTVIQEAPQFTLDYLIGNIGGNLSLFTGMSFMSFVELLELALSSAIVIFGFYSSRKLKN